MAKTYSIAAVIDSGVDESVKVFASYSLAAGAYAELIVAVRNAANESPAVPVITDGGGRTWTLRESPAAFSTSRRIYMWNTQNAGSTTGTTTATWDGVTIRSFQGAIGEVEGSVDSPAFVQSISATGTGTQGAATLSAFGNAANGVIASMSQSDTFSVYTEESGWTGKLLNDGREAVSLGITYKADANDTSPTIDSDVNTAWGFIASEVKDTAGVAGLSIPIAAYHYNHHLRSMT